MLSKRELTSNITHIASVRNGKVQYFKLDAKGKLVNPPPSAANARFSAVTVRPPPVSPCRAVQDYFPPVTVPSPAASPLADELPDVFSLEPFPDTMFVPDAPNAFFEFDRPSLFDAWATAGPPDDHPERLWDPFPWAELEHPAWN
jgi:hypothetical protein